MTADERLVLASASPRRRQLLQRLGVPFDALALDLDESIPEGVNPEIVARRIARMKAEAARLVHLERPVLTADTVVVDDGRILGKPADAAEAREMLHSLRGREHRVITAVALLPRGAVQALLRHAVTAVRMRDYTDAEIEASIAHGDPFDKAGAYAIQDPEFAPVAAYNGCYCNVVGFPLWAAAEMLRKTGLAPAADAAALLPQCAECPLRPPETNGFSPYP